MKLHDNSFKTPYSVSVGNFFEVRFQLIMLCRVYLTSDTNVDSQRGRKKDGIFFAIPLVDFAIADLFSKWRLRKNYRDRRSLMLCNHSTEISLPMFNGPSFRKQIELLRIFGTTFRKLPLTSPKLNYILFFLLNKHAQSGELSSLKVNEVN